MRREREVQREANSPPTALPLPLSTATEHCQCCHRWYAGSGSGASSANRPCASPEEYQGSGVVLQVALKYSPHISGLWGGRNLSLRDSFTSCDTFEYGKAFASIIKDIVSFAQFARDTPRERPRFSTKAAGPKCSSAQRRVSSSALSSLSDTARRHALSMSHNAGRERRGEGGGWAHWHTPRYQATQRALCYRKTGAAGQQGRGAHGLRREVRHMLRRRELLEVHGHGEPTPEARTVPFVSHARAGANGPLSCPEACGARVADWRQAVPAYGNWSHGVCHKNDWITQRPATLGYALCNSAVFLWHAL